MTRPAFVSFTSLLFLLEGFLRGVMTAETRVTVPLENIISSESRVPRIDASPWGRGSPTTERQAIDPGTSYHTERSRLPLVQSIFYISR